MTHQEILNLRLYSQQLTDKIAHTPAEVVHALGAVQAQDYAGSQWSIALRTKSPTQSAIEKAITDRSIVRTWPMRGTLHFIAAEDVRWMLSLLTPRVQSGMERRRKELELDTLTLTKSHDLLLKALDGGKQLMRSEVYSVLENNGITTTNQRGIHIINYLAQNQVLCHGSHNEKQPTYVLLDEWIPKSKELSSAEALAEITLRYFTSHGPATIQDFVWWTGLKLTDARTGLTSVNQFLTHAEIEGTTYWFIPELRDVASVKTTFMLPGFDEYMLGYTNRTLMVEKLHLPKVVPGNNGMFMPTVVVNGKVEALWKRAIKKDRVVIDLYPFNKLSNTTLKKVARVAQQYGNYLNKEVAIQF